MVSQYFINGFLKNASASDDDVFYETDETTKVPGNKENKLLPGGGQEIPKEGVQ